MRVGDRGVDTARHNAAVQKHVQDRYPLCRHVTRVLISASFAWIQVSGEAPLHTMFNQVLRQMCAGCRSARTRLARAIVHAW
jgi:hypothetical protein